MAPRVRFVPGNPLWCPRRMREKNRGTAGSCGTPRSRAGRKIWKNSGLSPWMHRWICSASAGKSHHTEAEPSPALPLPAPSQISKGRAEGISSQKEYQDLILLGGKNPHQTQTSSSCLEIQGWQGAADGATSIWSRKAAGGDPAGQDPAGKSSLAQTEPPLTPQMW